MRREWEPDVLIECWTLVEDDWELVANKSGPTRLGFAVLLKFFEIEGRFPRHGGEVPRAVVAYLAAQLKVPADAFADYEWTGRTIEYHRAQIRAALGFREPTVADEDALAGWLAREVCPTELSEARRREALAARCRAERIEPPTPGRVDRILASAQESCDTQFTVRTLGRLFGRRGPAAGSTRRHRPGRRRAWPAGRAQVGPRPPRAAHAVEGARQARADPRRRPRS